jgi:uncharacterized protein (TIGR03437 family)
MMSRTFQRSLLAVLALLSPLTAAAVNVITGSMTLSNTVSSEEVANLDTGTRSPGDLAFMTPGILVPQGNATAANNVGTGESVYDDLTPNTLKGLDYSPDPVTISVNDVFAMKTNGGHLVKLFLTDVTSSSVTFMFTAYGAKTGQEVLEAFPSRISLNYQVGTTPLPTQTFTVNGTAGPERFNLYALTYSGTNFFGLGNGSSGVTPWTEHTSLLSNLFVRPYTGAIYGQSQDQPYTSITIPVTADVTSEPTVYVNPARLNFIMQAGTTTAPPDQCFWLTMSGPPEAYIFSASNSALTFDPPSGTPPLKVSVGINPQAFTGVTASNIAFDYSLTGTSANALTFSLGVNVFVVGPKTPIITSVVNSGSFFPSTLSANEIVSVFGQNLASTTQGAQVTSAGMLPTTVDGTSVSLNAGSNGNFDGSLIYISPNQINVSVPQINGAATATLQVLNNGQVSNSFPLSLVNYNCPNDRAKEECPPAPAPNPALFTLNGAGNGPAAALNQDGTPNGPNNPAEPGSIIQLFGTGFGPTSPQQATGSVTSTTGPFPTLATPPTVTIGGQPAPIVYAGAAPGLVAGVVQVNVSIPNLKPGPYLAAVSVGTTPNPQPQAVLILVESIAGVP